MIHSPVSSPVASPVGSPLAHPLFGGWTPAKLFAGGVAGAWYEPSPTTCYTDVAMTTPAGVGDTVAAVADLSGNGNHATQATAASQPKLQQTAGGLYYLDFDGVDDFLNIPVAAQGAITTSNTLSVGIRRVSTAGTQYLHGQGLDNGFGAVISSTKLRPYVKYSDASSTAASGSTVITVGTDYVLTAEFSRTIPRLRGWIGATSEVDVAASDKDKATASTNTVASKGSPASLVFGGRLYSFIVVASAAGDDARLRAYTAEKAGVTL